MMYHVTGPVFFTSVDGIAARMFAPECSRARVHSIEINFQRGSLLLLLLLQCIRQHIHQRDHDRKSLYNG